MSDSKIIQLDRGAMGNRPCHLCMEVHVPQNKCKFDVLAKRVNQLLLANQVIPQLMANVKEAATTAAYFQNLLKQADKAHEILMNILSRHGDIGKTIEQQYLEGLNLWAAATMNQEAEKPQEELSTSSETSDKLSTNPESGKSSPLILSP